MRCTRAWFPFVLLVAGVACDGTPVAPPPAAITLARPEGELRDARIVRDDSWFTARVTMAVDAPEASPGAALRVDEPSALARSVPAISTIEVEAGYGASGELRFGAYWAPEVPTVAITGVRLAGDRMEYVNAAGTVLSSSTFGTEMTMFGFPGGTLVGGVLRTSDPAACDPVTGCASLVAGDDAAAVSSRDPNERRLRRRVAAPRLTTALTGDGDYSETEHVYRRQRQADGEPDLWRLEKVVAVTRLTGDDGPSVRRTTLTFNYQRYRVNARRERLRAEVASARAAAARSVLDAQPAPVATGTRSADDFAAPEANSALDLFCPTGTRNDDVVNTKKPGGLSLLYQHGFCSNASKFDGIRPLIAQRVPVRRERAFSLNSTDRIEDQVSDLMGRLAASGGGSNLVIGHSQGGLVARRLGQRAPHYVQGVITIGTPHQGAALASWSAEAYRERVASMISQICGSAFLCELIYGIDAEQRKGILQVGSFDNHVGSLQDLAPESPFLNALNSTPESFVRMSLAVQVDRRWSIARMVGDAQTPVSDLLAARRPAGDAWVTRAEQTYRLAMVTIALSSLVLFPWEPNGFGVDCGQTAYSIYWTPCTNVMPRSSWLQQYWQETLAMAAILFAGKVMSVMNDIDHTWNALHSPSGSPSDGLISVASQDYAVSPGTHAPTRMRVLPPRSDSHAGQLASTSTFERLLDAVRSYVVVP